jgi:hypothetical protein
MLPNNTSSWLEQFYQHPDVGPIVGDDLGTTLHMCGAVVLAAIHSATISPDRLSDITGLPAAFCGVVIANLDYNRSWSHDNFLELCAHVRDDNSEDIVKSLEWLLDDFWMQSKLPGIHIILPALRGRRLLFGRQQTWIGDEHLEDFVGQLAIAVPDKGSSLRLNCPTVVPYPTR